jgi:translation initiation factor 3 subunit B
MFVEFKNVDDASLALATIHNHPFDARHIFKANRLTDIEKYSSTDETYIEPEFGEYTPKVTVTCLYTT